METADEFRRRGADADAMAARTVDTVLKQGFVDVARQWRALADQADERDVLTSL
jgi:hypothetical protein